MFFVFFILFCFLGGLLLLSLTGFAVLFGFDMVVVGLFVGFGLFFGGLCLSCASVSGDGWLSSTPADTS